MSISIIRFIFCLLLFARFVFFLAMASDGVQSLQMDGDNSNHDILGKVDLEHRLHPFDDTKMFEKLRAVRAISSEEDKRQRRKINLPTTPMKISSDTDIQCSETGENVVQVTVTADNGSQITTTVDKCPSLDSGLQKAHQRVEQTTVSLSSAVEVHVEVMIMRKGVHTVEDAVVIPLSQPNPDESIQESNVKYLYWTLNVNPEMRDEQVIVTASATSQQLQHGSASNSLALFTVHFEKTLDSGEQSFSLALEDIHFRDMSSILYIGPNHENEVSFQRLKTFVFINRCQFERIGWGSPNSSVIDIADVTDGVTLHVAQSSFQNCNSGGIQIQNGNGHNITISGVDILDSKSDQRGVALAIIEVSSARILLDHCRIMSHEIRNSVSGAIWINLSQGGNNSQSEVIIRDSHISSNNVEHVSAASSGGGITIENHDHIGMLEFLNCTVNNNSISGGGPNPGFGGGVYVLNNDTGTITELNFSNCTISSNVINLAGLGGGISVTNHGILDHLRIDNCNIGDNAIDYKINKKAAFPVAYGGGIFVRNEKGGKFNNMTSTETRVYGNYVNGYADNDNSIHDNDFSEENDALITVYGGGVAIIGSEYARFTNLDIISNSAKIATENRPFISGGGFMLSAQEAIFDHCEFRDNEISSSLFGYGAGIMVDGYYLPTKGNGARVKFADCTFSNNSLRFQFGEGGGDATSLFFGGGVIVTNSGNVTMHNCEVENNTVTSSDDNNDRYATLKVGQGGGAAFFGVNHVEVSKNEDNQAKWSHNSADYDGGALWINSAESLKISLGNAFISNRAGTQSDKAHGGAIYMDSVKVVDMQGLYFEENQAGGKGGAIAMASVLDHHIGREIEVLHGATISHCLFFNNAARYGGGAVFTFAHNIVTIEHCTFEGNRVLEGKSDKNGGGGALMFMGKSIEITRELGTSIPTTSFGTIITNSNFSENSVEGGNGGAILSMDMNVWISIEACRFQDHRAYGSGGVAYVASGHSSFKDLRVSDGSSWMGNGGCFALRGLIVEFHGITLERCHALNGGGGAIQIFHKETSITASMYDISIQDSVAGSGDGGGILCMDMASCALNIRDGNPSFELVNNRALNGTGGGFACTNRAQCKLSIETDGRIMINGNRATSGGGISVINAELKINTKAESSISLRHNSATADGGALYIREYDSSSGGGGTIIDMNENVKLRSPTIVIAENHAAFGGAVMLSTTIKRSHSRLISTTPGGSFVIDPNACRFIENRAILAGGTFFIVAPSDALQNPDKYLLPADWWDDQMNPSTNTTMIETSSVSPSGYGRIVATNPASIRTEWTAIETNGIPKNTTGFPISAGSTAWINVTVLDAFGTAVRGYPQHHPDQSIRQHHPIIDITIDSSHPFDVKERNTAKDNDTFAIHLFRFNSSNEKASAYCGNALATDEAGETGIFTLCNGEDVPVQFSILLSSPYIEEKGKFYLTTTMKMDDSDGSGVSKEGEGVVAQSRLSLNLKACRTHGMVAYHVLDKIELNSLWTCKTSSCTWFDTADEYSTGARISWIIITPLSFFGAALGLALVAVVIRRRLHGVHHSWLLRLSIGLSLSMKYGTVIFISALGIAASSVSQYYTDALFSTGIRQSQLYLVKEYPGWFYFAALADVFGGTYIVVQLIIALWFLVLLMELSALGYSWLNWSPFAYKSAKAAEAATTRKSSFEKYQSRAGNLTLRNLVHFGIIITICLTVFGAGLGLRIADIYNGWMVIVVEGIVSLVSVVPLSMYLFELLSDRRGSWKQLELLWEMSRGRMWFYRLRHASSVIGCWILLTWIEPLLLSSLFLIPSGDICRPLLLSITSTVMHILQSVLVPVVIHTIPTMPDRSRKSRTQPVRGGTNTSNLSEFLLLDDQDLAEIVLEEMLPPRMIIAPENLEYGEILGSGAQGSVFKGKLLSSGGAAVAIKAIPKADMNQAASFELRGFYRELLTLYEHGNHPNIVRLMGICDDKRKISLVLELCSGGSLADLLQRNADCRSHGSQPIVTFSQKLRILLDVAAGMCHLHDRELIHRDLKPENVLLSDRMFIGTAKVADLGVAKSNRMASSNMTMNVGTAAYVAPEVFKGATVSQSTSQLDLYDERCDVYSFGVLMYAVLGDVVHPYGNKTSDLNIVARMTKDPKNFRPPHDEQTVDFVQQCIENNHRWYVDLMCQCWHVNPTERPSFNTVAERLRPFALD